jgi:hypothetical protein
MENQEDKEDRYLFKGMTTDPDVKELIDRIGIPSVGDTIAYDLVEEIIGSPYDSNRWTSVTQAWRKKLIDDPYNIYLIADKPNFRVATNSERVNVARGKQRTGARAIARGAVLAQRTDKTGLSEEEKKQRDYSIGVVARLRLAELTAPKDVNGGQDGRK